MFNMAHCKGWPVPTCLQPATKCIRVAGPLSLFNDKRKIHSKAGTVTWLCYPKHKVDNAVRVSWVLNGPSQGLHIDSGLICDAEMEKLLKQHFLDQGSKIVEEPWLASHMLRPLSGMHAWHVFKFQSPKMASCFGFGVKEYGENGRMSV